MDLHVDQQQQQPPHEREAATIPRLEAIKRLHRKAEQFEAGGGECRVDQFEYTYRVMGFTGADGDFAGGVTPLLGRALPLAQFLHDAQAGVDVEWAWAELKTLCDTIYQGTVVLTFVRFADIDTAVPTAIIHLIDRVRDTLPSITDRIPSLALARAEVDRVRAERVAINKALAKDEQLQPGHAAALYLRAHPHLRFSAGTEPDAAALHAAFEGHFLTAEELEEGVVECGLVGAASADFADSLDGEVEHNHGCSALIKIAASKFADGVPRYGCGRLPLSMLQKQYLATQSLVGGGGGGGAGGGP